MDAVATEGRRDGGRLILTKLAVVVVVAAAFVFVSLLYPWSILRGAVVDSRSAAVERAARDALVAELTADVAPATIPPNQELTAEQASALRDSVRPRLASHFTGSRLNFLADRIRAAAAIVDHGGSRTLDGGVTNVVFISVDASDAEATVDVRATAWAESRSIGADGRIDRARPSADERYHLVLQNTAGRWLVSDETREFLPGSGP